MPDKWKMLAEGNLRTINGFPITGRGNLTVGAVWGGIGGALINQNDLQAELNAKEPADANIQRHISSTSNPHSVTKTQVGLGSVDNTSDANKPVSTAQQTALDGKQSALVSGTNVKTINGDSVLGSGNLVVSGAAAWGSVTGTLANQTDLQAALDAKLATSGTAADVNVSGTAIAAALSGKLGASATAADVNPSGTSIAAALGGKVDESVLVAKGDLLTASAASTPAVITAAAVNKVLTSAGAAQYPVWYSPPYCISGCALSFAMVSSTQYYFGVSAAPTTTKGLHRIYIPVTGTMIASQVSWARTGGSASSSWTMNYYYNGGNAVSMGAIATAANVVWLKTGDTLAVTAGQYIEFGTSTPAWGANQTGLLSFWLLIMPSA